MSQRKEKWEIFDAETLFTSPQLHTNCLTKVDKKEMTKVDTLENRSDETVGDSNNEEMDSYSEAPADISHVDELFEMEGSDFEDSDDREVNADKEVDRRTEESDKSEPEEKNESDNKKSDSSDKEGADKPIQKESEGIEEVAEATSKTSEDVHGGDEATKDIEDSPNAADDGQNSANEGAESGQDGEDGEDSNPEGDGSDSEEFKDLNQPDGESDDVSSVEEWENEADYSANSLQLENNLEELEAKLGQEEGHRTSLPSYEFDRKDSPIELETAFKKGRELIQKMAAEEDVSSQLEGYQKWDVKRLCRNVVSYKHSKIPASKFERPKDADIKILLDISGSCQAQAEMFMAIAAGAIGNGVEIYVGYNGSCRASAMRVPKRLPRSYRQAKEWVQAEMERVSGWENQEKIGEWSFSEFVEEKKPKVLIIFGDWDGIDQYQEVVSRRCSSKIFWFCNYGRRGNDADLVPENWNRKNYFSGVYTPQDLVKALRKIR